MKTENLNANEEEYFVRQQEDSRREWALNKQREAKEAASADRQRLKDLHFMHCPRCGTELQAWHSRNVRIERCPSCTGTWLDAGKLDQFMAKGSGFLMKMFGS